MALHKEIFMKKKKKSLMHASILSREFSKMIQNCEKQLSIQPHWVGYGLEVRVPPLAWEPAPSRFPAMEKVDVGNQPFPHVSAKQCKC